jgi:hypothetical protein
MKICWNNLENLTYRPDREDWQKFTGKYYHFYDYKEKCKNCGEAFLFYKRTKNTDPDFCCKSCANKSIDNRKSNSITKKGKKRPEHSKWIKEYYKNPANHPNWKGGVSFEPYCQIWSDKEYKESIRERDGHRCLNPECNKKSSKLRIHHINYNKKDCRPNNLITVCVSCNSKANYNRNWHKAWYKAIITRRCYEN